MILVRSPLPMKHGNTTAGTRILKVFNAVMDKAVTPASWLCGHTITVFDAPFIAKRCIVNRVPLHERFFDVSHLKPWEVPYLDLATLWKGTGFKTTPLVTMTNVLGVPSPKDDISGADVGRVFYEGGIIRIVIYCEKDVIATIQIYMALCYKDPLEVVSDTLTVEVDVMEYLAGGGELTPEISDKVETLLGSLNKTDRKRAINVLNALQLSSLDKKGVPYDIFWE